MPRATDSLNSQDNYHKKLTGLAEMHHDLICQYWLEDNKYKMQVHVIAFNYITELIDRRFT